MSRSTRLLVLGICLSVRAVVSGGSKPLQFTEGPFTWDDVYASGELCAFPVRVQGTIVAEQTWFGFPPEGDDAWTSHTRFRGTETWTNLDTGAAATDAFRYNVVHEWLGFVLQRTIQTGNGTNVMGGHLKEAGRIVWDGEAFVLDSFRGRFVQFPDFSDWITARCDTIAN